MKLINSKEEPCRGAIHQGGDLWLTGDDDAQLTGEVTELTGTDARSAVPRRYDLDPDHPLYGQRALTNVPAGFPDIVVDDKGFLAFAVAEAQVIDDEPIDVGRGIR